MQFKMQNTTLKYSKKLLNLVRKTIDRTCLQQYMSSYKTESKKKTFTVEKSYNKTVIDFNSGSHKDLSTLIRYIRRGRKMNITFSGR